MIIKEHLYNSIRDKIKETFPLIAMTTDAANSPIQSGFDIKYLSGISRQTSEDYQCDEMSFKVIYYSEEKTNQDLFNVEKSINEIFKKPLKIQTENFKYYLEINDIKTSFSETDYTLSCILDIVINQLIEIENRYDEYDNDEYMQELEII